MAVRRLPAHDWSATSESGVIGVDGAGVRVEHAAAPEDCLWLGASTAFAWHVPAGERRHVTVLPYPAPHLVLLDHRLMLCGFTRARLVRDVAGTGTAFTLALRPGALQVLFGIRDAASVLNTAVPLARCLGPLRTEALADALDAAPTAPLKAAVTRTHFAGQCTTEDTEAHRARDVIEAVLRADHGTRVRASADRHGLSIRSLQRLFRTHLGTGPKSATRRRRLLDAATELRRRPDPWTRVAAQLGYFDQPHFINDFTKDVGITPAAFATQCRTQARAPSPETRNMAWFM